jgi:hypothetical protein
VLVRRSGIELIQIPVVNSDDLARLPPRASGLPELLERAYDTADKESTIERYRSIMRNLRSGSTRDSE